MEQFRNKERKSKVGTLDANSLGLDIREVKIGMGEFDVQEVADKEGIPNCLLH